MSLHLFQCKDVDIICVNKYFGWYSGIGETYLIPLQLPGFLSGYHTKYGHPVIMTEYGAETIPGMHNVSMQAGDYGSVYCDTDLSYYVHYLKRRQCVMWQGVMWWTFDKWIWEDCARDSIYGSKCLDPFGRIYLNSTKIHNTKWKQFI